MMKIWINQAVNKFLELQGMNVSMSIKKLEGTHQGAFRFRAIGDTVNRIISKSDILPKLSVKDQLNVLVASFLRMITLIN
jgi:hypothetical protein